MSDVAFALASRQDDAGIRRLLATNPMPGRIRVRFEREPDYFAGCATMGPFTQVLVARDGDRVVGVACRAVRTLFINGHPEPVGYLGQLRVDREYRGRLLVARGFRKLRELQADGKAHGTITTIVDGNVEAEGVLVRKARSAMPRYRPIDRLFTLAIGARVSRVSDDRRSGPAREEISAFLTAHSARRNFSSVVDDIPLDFVSVERQGKLAGVAALADHRAWKQTVIDGYDNVLRLTRPLVNVAARALGKPTLPKPGTALENAYASLFCTVDDDGEVARELIERLLALAAERRLDHVLFGFMASDPLLAVARRFKPVEYPSTLYTVSWDDEDDLHDRLDSRPRALEIAAL